MQQHGMGLGRNILSVFGLALVTGCSSGSSDDQRSGWTESVAFVPGPGPELRLADSLVLVESDTLFLGKVGQTFFVDDAGMMYFPDEFTDRLIQYTPRGIPNRIYGRHGRGPGELNYTGATFVTDSFVVQENGSRRLTVYDRNTGAYRFTRSYRGYIISVAEADGKLWFGNFDLVSGRGLFAVTAAEFFRPAPSTADSILTSTEIPFPGEYETFPALGMFNMVIVTPVTGGMLIGFAGTNPLLYYGTTSGRVDTLDLPIVNRRGVSTTRLKLFGKGSTSPRDKQLAAISGLYGLWTMSDGSVLIWHGDNSAEARGTDLINFTSEAFISILSPDRTRACADSRLPVPGSGWPRIAVARDTLYVLDQVVPEHGPLRASSVVRRYVASSAKCHWLPVRIGIGK